MTGMLRRTHKGLAMIGAVVAFLIAAPTIAFWLQEGFDAVIAYWVSLIFLVGLTLYGAYLVVTDRAVPPAPTTAFQKGTRVKHRSHVGFLLIALVGLVLVLAPTIVFWFRYGGIAVFAHWACVVLLAVMLVVGGYLVFTDRLRDARRPEIRVVSPKNGGDEPPSNA